MRLIAFYGEDAIRAGRIEGDEVVVGGGPLDPTGRLDDEFEDAARLVALERPRGAAARWQGLEPAPITAGADQDRVRRPELPRARRGRRPRRHRRAAPLREVRRTPSSGTAIRSSGPRARTPWTSRSSSASSSVGGPAASPATTPWTTSPATSSSTTSAPATGRAPAGAARGREGRRPVAPRQGLGHVPADGSDPRHGRRARPAAGLRLRSWRIDRGRHRAPDAGRHDRRHDPRRPGARRVHQLGHHARARRRHRDRHAVRRRRLPRPAGVPGAR